MIKNLKTKIMQCLFLLMGTMALLTSCHKDDDGGATPDVNKPATYTVMLYGCGAGTDALPNKLSQIEALGKTDRVNFTGLVKFSKDCQNEATKEGTRLFTLTKGGMKNEKVHDASYRMDNPAHLAQFIKETKEKMPADKYILIFWGPSWGFGYGDTLLSDADYTEQPGSRSLLYDDNVDYSDDDYSKSLSVYEIEKGIKDSGIKMDLVYMNVNNYGMAEVNYQLKDCTKYLMASASLALDSNYSELLEDLQANESLEEAIKVYVPNCMKKWQDANKDKEQVPGINMRDLECYDLSYMDEFAGYLKDAVGEFKNTVQEASQRQKELDALYDGVVGDDFYGLFMGHTDELPVFSSGDCWVDVCSAFSFIGDFTLNGNMSHYAEQMKSTLDKMLVAHASCNILGWMDKISMGLVWPTNEFYGYLKNENTRMADNLKYAALYQATGWGDLLLNLNNSMTWQATTPQGCEVYLLGKYGGSICYIWQYDIELDLSNVSQENVGKVESSRKELLGGLNANAEEHPAGLCLGKYIFDEAKELVEFYKTDFTDYGVHKLKLKIYVEEVDPDDSFKDTFPTEIVKEIEL